MTIRFPNVGQWEKLLGRWSDFPACGEKNLLCAVIALAIEDARKGGDMHDIAHAERFWGGSFENICSAIHLNPAFVREQILLASSKVGLPSPSRETSPA